MCISLDTADEKKKRVDPMKLIGTRKKGIKRELNRLKKQHQKSKQSKLKTPDSSRGTDEPHESTIFGVCVRGS